MAINKRIIKSNDEAAGGASFNTVLYTGDGTSNRTITGYGFDPDFLWMKPRNFSYANNLYDTVRGDGIRLVSNSTAGDQDIQYLKFTTDGFIEDASRNNEIGVDYVVWGWKAAGYANTFNVLENGVTTTGSTAASVGISTTGANMTLTSASVNKDAGFSITTNTGGSDYPQWVSHGLGVIPDLLITKQRNNSATWQVNVGPNIIDSQYWKGGLNTNLAFSVNTRQMTTTVSPHTYTPITQSFVTYAFKSVAGFSKIGSYPGTGVAGNFQNCGFEPAFVMMKAYNTGSSWFVVDNKRNSTNPRNSFFRIETSNAEVDAAAGVNFLENGFEFTGQDFNDSGVSWIFMAFANQF